MHTTAKKNRIIRFSLRTFLLAVTLTAILIGWHTYRVRIQRDAVATITEVGGTVDYSHHFEAIHNDAWVHVVAEPPGPKWLRGLLGNDYFSRVISVELREAKTDCIDEILMAVGDLPHVRFLDLQNQPVTDEGLFHVRDLSSLEGLLINGSEVTDEGMAYLAGLNNLVELDIEDTSISDVGIANACIERKQRLRYLKLGFTQISEASLLRLESVPSLRLLTCDRTNVTLTGVERFKKTHPNASIIDDSIHEEAYESIVE